MFWCPLTFDATPIQPIALAGDAQTSNLGYHPIRVKHNSFRHNRPMQIGIYTLTHATGIIEFFNGDDVGVDGTLLLV